MKIKWESNGRVKQMVADGIIDSNDVIKRTTTDKFPAECATVRMREIANRNPWVTVHVRGRSFDVKGLEGTGIIVATTMRAGLGYGVTASLSGELSEELTFEDVHKVVSKVKKAMEV
ncbi:MAG: hypothetical protein H8E05_01330 [Bacteroidetes bacterium]|nr:hypothetical protein [Bacteroidota bacterium]